MLNVSVPAAAPGLPNARVRPSHRSHLFVSNPTYDAAAASRIVIFRADLPAFASPLKTLAATAPCITAVFPCEPAMEGMMLGFTRDEGHMSCSRLWFDMSRPASPEQYADLAGHLRARGYDLDIRHRITPAMETTRDWRWKSDRLLDASAGEAVSPARSACLQALDICEAVSGFAPSVVLAKRNGGKLAVSLARAGAVWIAHHTFGLPLHAVAEAYSRRACALAETLKLAERRRAHDERFALTLSMMERMARERMPTLA